MKIKKNGLGLICFIISILFTNNLFAQQQNQNCEEWHNKIDSSKPLIITTVKSKSESEILFAIDCFLQLEGKNLDSNVKGATSGAVSDIFFATPVEVAALYYISYLFYDKWDHADAPFLIDKNSKRNTDEAVCESYKAYKKWFKKVKEIGLDEARKQKLDPLADSGIRWY
jgi:hypothetical protein